MITTLDPRFTAVYEFAAVVLPAVDASAAVALLEKGIQANPDQWYLHQQLAYIFWQRGDNLAAADAFRRGARMTTARWMEYMAERLERQGDDPNVARAMYTRMYEQAQDEQVKQWALKRLMELRSLQERDVIRRVLSDFVATNARCPRAWTDVAPALQAAGLTRPRPGAAARSRRHALRARDQPARLRREPPPLVHGAARMNAIELQGLTKDYPTGFLHLRRTRVLDGLSLTVQRGEIFGFLGGNGAGKTTTIKILMRLMAPTAGRARLLGHDAGDVAVHARVGYLPEAPYFYDYLTARELLQYCAELFGYPRPARRARAADLLRARRPRRVGLGPPAPEVLQGHAAAGGAGPGPRQRSRAGGAGRAHERARPDRPPPGARPHRRPPRGRRDGVLLLAHHRGHRGAVRSGGHSPPRPAPAPRAASTSCASTPTAPVTWRSRSSAPRWPRWRTRSARSRAPG